MTTERNPYTPPTAVVIDHHDAQDIDALPVSETWKARFRAIRKAGGPKRPYFKELSRQERKQALGFNALAYLFGPFYYLAKGMWRKSITLLVLALALFVVLNYMFQLMGWGTLSSSLKFGIAAIYASYANTDYYRKMVLGENGWW